MLHRMEKIKEVFLEGNLNTSEIAQKFGFTHVQHFSNSFKKYFGVSPRQFLKNQAF